jgi:16S rRNA U516 pseudouridylate synthase RsuA-like enzyme
MTAADEQPTVLDRLLAAGINRERAVQHLEAGRVSVDGAIVTDPEHVAPKPARVVLVAV